MKKNLLLLHGWDYTLYTKMTTSVDAWSEYSELLAMLSDHYNVYKLNFPGFCGTTEPKEKEWSMEDFSKYVDNYINDNALDIDLIVGYSFGGAVAVDYANRFKSSAKLFLIAPAIIRNTYKSKKFVTSSKILLPLRKVLRNVYVSYIIKNNEMRYGTRFLKNTYQNIVRIDERELLYNIDYNMIGIVYGNNDTAVNPQEMLKTVKKDYADRIVIIDDADHDNIIVQYVNELADAMNRLL